MVKYSTPFGDAFSDAFSWLMENEGIVVTNDPDDPGGLTVCGISKVYNPSWSGWKEIEAGIANGSIKYRKNLPKNYVENVISGFYYENYWKKFWCDLVPTELAREMFDQAVNPGPLVMAKNLQEVLNTLNYDTKTKKRKYEDLVVDGKLGPKTKALLLEVASKNAKFLALAMNAKQGAYYLTLASNNVLKRKYVKGWINGRISF